MGNWGFPGVSAFTTKACYWKNVRAGEHRALRWRHSRPEGWPSG